MADWTGDVGLLNAIGSCSSESESVVSRALTYLGISYVKARAAFVASLAPHSSSNRLIDNHVNNEIEFDHSKGLWHNVRKENDSRSDHVPHLAVAQNDEPDDALVLANDPSPTDWTSLLPKTSHVDFLKSREWHKTSLGPMLTWPRVLQVMVMKMLDDPRPANLYWSARLQKPGLD